MSKLRYSMGPIIALIAWLVVPCVAFAQTTCPARLTVPFPPAQATLLCKEFGSAYGQSQVPSATATYDLGSSARTWRDLWLGRDLALSAAIGTVRSDTADGADSKRIEINSGGAAGGEARGAYLRLFGNESASPGNLFLGAGLPGASFYRGVSHSFQNGDGTAQYWAVTSAGNFEANATNGGDLIISRTGRTISLQEATPASACMGVATPNGNTNVTVTTSCAVTGARIFYTRVGAVTNMASISTTTNPAGASFQFASTNAADTLASSVVWMIVKESA